MIFSFRVQDFIYYIVKNKPYYIFHSTEKSGYRAAQLFSYDMEAFKPLSTIFLVNLCINRLESYLIAETIRLISEDQNLVAQEIGYWESESNPVAGKEVRVNRFFRSNSSSFL